MIPYKTWGKDLDLIVKSLVECVSLKMNNQCFQAISLKKSNDLKLNLVTVLRPVKFLQSMQMLYWVQKDNDTIQIILYQNDTL